MSASFLKFVWENKWWWLGPLLALLVLVLLLLVAGNRILPFGYTMF